MKIKSHEPCIVDSPHFEQLLLERDFQRGRANFFKGQYYSIQPKYIKVKSELAELEKILHEYEEAIGRETDCLVCAIPSDKARKGFLKVEELEKIVIPGNELWRTEWVVRWNERLRRERNSQLARAEEAEARIDNLNKQFYWIVTRLREIATAPTKRHWWGGQVSGEVSKFCAQLLKEHYANSKYYI